MTNIYFYLCDLRLRLIDLGIDGWSIPNKQGGSNHKSWSVSVISRTFLIMTCREATLRLSLQDNYNHDAWLDKTIMLVVSS